MSRWTAPSTITGLLVVLSSLISGCSHSERDAAGFWASESVVLRISREGENGEHYTVEWKEFLRGSRGSFTGPTLAVKILSGLAAPDLILAIRRGEVEKLVKVPGVGKKTAERMVLELRDKLPATRGDEPGTPPAEALSPVDQDVLSALLNL